MRRCFWLPLAGAVLFASCVIVRHEDKNAGGKKEGLDIYFANGSFDAKSYVSKLWDARLVPYVKGKAVETGALLSRLEADEAGASKEYGRRQVAEGAPFNFATKGEAVVLSASTESRAGTAQLDIYTSAKGPDGKSDIVLQIGPVFKGSSIRDALPFVSFDEFVNQLDYAALSNELNARVRDSVYAGVDPTKIVGKKVAFYGFFTYEHGVPVVLTPVILEWK